MKKNGHCSAQDKYHFRKYPDLLLWLKAAVIAVLVILLWSCEAATEKYPATQAGYLCSAFNATPAPNYWLGGRLCIYQSSDGVSWQSKYTDTYATATENCWIRDPSIVKIGNVYLGVYTVAESVIKNFCEVIQSTDLQSWTKVAAINTYPLTEYPTPPDGYSWWMDSDIVQQCWAPELFVDGENVYVIMGVTLMTLPGNRDTYYPYYSQPVTPGDYTSWTTPVPITGDFPISNGVSSVYTIDQFIIKDSGTYYLFYKNNATTYVCLATSTSPMTGYTIVKTGDWAGWGSGVEGPSVVKLPNGRFRIYFDDYTPLRNGIFYSETDDILNGTWSAPVRCTFPTADGATQHPTVREY